MRILAFGGSLREGSFNRALLVEAAAMAPQGTVVDLELLPVIGALPLFNQDVAARVFPPEAAALKEALRAADGLLVASPEYNWGVPGYLRTRSTGLHGRPPTSRPCSVTCRSRSSAPAGSPARASGRRPG